MPLSAGDKLGPYEIVGERVTTCPAGNLRPLGLVFKSGGLRPIWRPDGKELLRHEASYSNVSKKLRKTA
jgi:hypothetical protein